MSSLETVGRVSTSPRRFTTLGLRELMATKRCGWSPVRESGSGKDAQSLAGGGKGGLTKLRTAGPMSRGVLCALREDCRGVTAGSDMLLCGVLSRRFW